MLYLIVVWAILLVVCSVIGSAIVNALNAECFDRIGDRTIVALWLGVLILSIALLVTSWFLPLSSINGIALAVILCGVSFKIARADLAKLWTLLYPNSILPLLALLVGIAAFTVRPVTWIDSGYYHVQAIQWLAKFGAVPGLALLLSHLGFTSSWFALAAPLNLESLSTLVVTNGLALLLAVLHGFVGVSHIYRHQARLCDWFIVCFSIILLPIVVKFHPILAEIFISPSPDMAILFVTGTIAWAMIAISASQQNFLPRNRILPFILASGAFAIKLVALPLLFVTGLFYLFSKQLKPIHLLLMITISITLLSPPLIHNVITSGCLIYPSDKLCLDLPWTPEIQDVKEVARGTHQWVRLNQATSGNPIAQQWRWFSRFVGNPKIVLILMAVSMISFVSLFTVRDRNSISGWQWMGLLALIGIGFFIKTSPMMRFWITYLCVLPIFLLAVYCQLQFGERLPKWIERLGKIPQASLFLPLFLTTILLIYGHSNLLLPPTPPKVSISSRSVNGIALSIPTLGAHCWTTPVPCVPQNQLLTRVQLRDPARGIGAGFVRLNPSNPD